MLRVAVETNVYFCNFILSRRDIRLRFYAWDQDHLERIQQQRSSLLFRSSVYPENKTLFRSTEKDYHFDLDNNCSEEYV